MSKLFKLKSWLTLDDSAQYLSIAFGEKITTTDLLQLVLEKKITVSVYLKNRVPTKRVEKAMLFCELPQNRSGFQREKDDILNIVNNQIIYLVGVVDLPMIGSERFFLENMYSLAINGKSIVNVEPRGMIFEYEGQLHIQQGLGKEKNKNSSEKEKYSGVGEVRYLKEAERNTYFNWQSFPEDSMLVFRTDVLREIELLINGALENEKKPITAKERNTLLIIIAALAKEAKIDLTKPSKAGEQIANMTELIGAAVDHSTIEQKIKQIPNALESRNK